MVEDVLERLERIGSERRAPGRSLLVVDVSDDPARIAEHRCLRRHAFVEEQGLFSGHDLDASDEDPDTRVLGAFAGDGRMRGGVRLHPAVEGGAALGWWQGSRLVCARGATITRGRVGSALVQAACASAVVHGALRFDAQVQAIQEDFFTRLGWRAIGPLSVAGHGHVLMRWPIERIAELVAANKAPLGPLVGELLRSDLWRGDDGAPVSGTDVVACTDAITPAMVERDPEWAGWCGILVAANDLAAMGATPVGALDALAAPDASTAAAVVSGLRRAAEAFGLPILGGHTHLGTPAALSVTGLGRSSDPIPGAGARLGDELTVSVDVAGGWRAGYRGCQWDSTSSRTSTELRTMGEAVARARPRAAKDVSMVGIVGTTGMLAEASGLGAELAIAEIPRPSGVAAGDWLTCFPGFGMLSADRRGAPPLQAGPAISGACGKLVREPGVRLRWPDNEVTTAISGAVTGLGRAS